MVVQDKKGVKADSKLRDFENVPLKEDVDAYFEREVKPHVPDAWMDRSKDKVGYGSTSTATSTCSRRHDHSWRLMRPKIAEEEVVRLSAPRWSREVHRPVDPDRSAILDEKRG